MSRRLQPPRSVTHPLPTPLCQHHSSAHGFCLPPSPLPPAPDRISTFNCATLAPWLPKSAFWWAQAPLLPAPRHSLHLHAPPQAARISNRRRWAVLVLGSPRCIPLPALIAPRLTAVLTSGWRCLRASGTGRLPKPSAGTYSESITLSAGRFGTAMSLPRSWTRG